MRSATTANKFSPFSFSRKKNAFPLGSAFFFLSVGVLRGETNYEKTRNYWKYLKAKLKKAGNELGSETTQLKFLAVSQT